MEHPDSSRYTSSVDEQCVQEHKRVEENGSLCSVLIKNEPYNEYEKTVKEEMSVDFALNQEDFSGGNRSSGFQVDVSEDVNATEKHDNSLHLRVVKTEQSINIFDPQQSSVSVETVTDQPSHYQFILCEDHPVISIDDLLRKTKNRTTRNCTSFPSVAVQVGSEGSETFQIQSDVGQSQSGVFAYSASQSLTDTDHKDETLQTKIETDITEKDTTATDVDMSQETDIDDTGSDDTDIDDISWNGSENGSFKPQEKADVNLNRSRQLSDKINLRDKRKENKCMVVVDNVVQKKQNTHRQSKKLKAPEIACQVCGNIYLSKNRLGVHIEECHYHSYVMQCSACFQPFYSFADQERHKCLWNSKLFHVHDCLACNNNTFFRYRENLVKHIETVHNNKFPLLCRICSLPLVSKMERTSHLFKKHRIVQNMDENILEKLDGTEEEKPIKLEGDEANAFELNCTKCGKLFYDPSKLERHEKRVCIEPTHECSACGKKFKSKKHLREHSIIHSDVRLYVCEMCGESYVHKSSLNIHIQSKHTMEKNYSCSLCGKEFVLYNSFKRHERMHTGTRPHKCSFCEKTFVTSWNRKAHERQHTKETPYKCSKCGTGFAHNVVRKNHEVICIG